MRNKKGRTVFITGASQGIGNELYRLFTENGDTAVSFSRTDRGNAANHIYCDVTEPGSVKTAVKEAVMRFGAPDIVINNAGAGLSGATELLTSGEVKGCMDVNYTGTLNMSRECLNIMKSGKIVNISSACALFPLPYRSVYCSAKAAVNMLSFSLRMELKSAGITVTSICPGDIRSTFTENRIKNFATSERYGDRVRAAADKIDSRENKRMDVKKAAKKIYRIASNKKGALYIVGAKYKVFYFFKKLLPERLFLKILGGLFG